MDSTLLQHLAAPFVLLVITAAGVASRIGSSTGTDRTRLVSRYAIVASGAMFGVIVGVAAYVTLN